MPRPPRSGSSPARTAAAAALALVVQIGVSGPVVANDAVRIDPSPAESEPAPRRAGAGLARRPDERRPDVGYRVELFGQTVRFGGEYEIAHQTRQNFDLDRDRARDRARLDQELQLEATFSPARDTTVFLQIEGVSEIDTWRESSDETSFGALRRGQTWVFVAEPGGLPLDLQVGRIGLIEARSWWWDQDIDAARIFLGDTSWLVETGIGERLMPVSTEERGIAAQAEALTRWFGRAAWMWRKRHNLEFFWLLARDHSGRPAAGRILHERRADESDADLDWFGMRAIGEERTDGGHRFGYWLDLARVHGTERLTDFSDVDSKRVIVDGHERQRVSGSAWDVGARWSLPGRARPTVWLGWASGSGDGNPDDGVDHAFRQTGLQANKGRFGGVKRIRYYGELFRPELSNLGIGSLGVSMRFLENSSVDLVLHDYRQRHASNRLPESRLDRNPTGNSRDLGRELDLFLAFRESDHLEFTTRLAAFRAGSAFATKSGEMAYDLELGMTINF
jgi:hypothetical protein